MLKEIREKRNLSQSELAELSKINLRTLQDYEQGHKDINNAKAITLFKLSKALGCNMESILNLGDLYEK